MADEIKRWEYYVKTVGGPFSTKDETIEALLNQLGEDGWEAVNVYPPENTGKVTIVVKRPLTVATRRQRSMPS